MPRRLSRARELGAMMQRRQAWMLGVALESRTILAARGWVESVCLSALDKKNWTVEERGSSCYTREPRCWWQTQDTEFHGEADRREGCFRKRRYDAALAQVDCKDNIFIYPPTMADSSPRST